ncbi:MAG TPA: M48 family metalloprotease [Candidatus Binatia bacterium]
MLNLTACGAGRVTPIGTEGLQTAEDEGRIWREARELQSRLDRSALIDEDVSGYVNQVASKIVPGEVKRAIEVRVKVMKHPAPNAFALPHGAVYVHSGFLARMDNEAQLAAVLAHEISHIIHRHALQTFRNVKQAAAVASTLAVIGAPAGLPGAGVILLGTVGALAAISGYSQSLEEDADAEGLRLMVNAGYDPGEAVKVIENVMRYVEQEEIKEPFFFSTHPRLGERQASYRQLVDTQYKDRGGLQGKADFTAKMADVFLDNALLEMARGRYALAHEAIEKSFAVESKNARAHYLLGELFRQRALEGDQARAEKEYQAAIDLEPRFAEPHKGIGLLNYKKGASDLAKRHFAKYLELNPAAKDRAYIEHYLREIETGRGGP